MGGLAGFLTALIPVVARVLLIKLGIGLVTYGAVIVTINALLNQAKAAYNGMPVEILQYLALGGVNHALAILSGAILARVALIPLQRFGFV